MEFFGRFKDVFSVISQNFISSFPFFNDKYEFVFFYTTVEKENENICVDKICVIFLRDRLSSEIFEVKPEDVLSETLLTELETEEFKSSVRGAEAISAVKRYYELYEKLFSLGNDSDDKQYELNEKLTSIFEQLVPCLGLRKIYSELKELND